MWVGELSRNMARDTAADSRNGRKYTTFDDATDTDEGASAGVLDL